MHYFRGPALSFAVPKKYPEVGQAWVDNGRNYKVVEKQSVAIMGIRTEVLVINGDEAFADTDKLLYYYSADRGLLGMLKLKTADQESYLVLSESGYGFPVRNCALPPDPKNRRRRWGMGQ
jgi:hypothetical protein